MPPPRCAPSPTSTGRPRLEASPLFATFLGDHRYDDRVDDLSAEAEQRLRATWVGLRERAAALDGDARRRRRRDPRPAGPRARRRRAGHRPAAGRDGVRPDGGRPRRPAHHRRPAQRPRARARGDGGRAHPGLRHDARPGRRPVPRRPRRRPHARPASTSSARSTRSRATWRRRSTTTRSPRSPGPEGWDGLAAWRAELADHRRATSCGPPSPPTATCCATSCCRSPGPTTAPASSTSPTAPRCTGR